MYMELLEKKLDSWGVDYCAQQIRKFYDFYVLLKEQNKQMNLTTNTDIVLVQEKHFIDSLSFLAFCKPKTGSSIIDIGTGAGFPGIPIGIMRSDFDLVLFDSSNKRTKFLELVVKTLELDNITVICDRAETLAHNNNYRERFDYCLSRAVAPLNILAEYCLPFLKLGGLFVAYKGPAVKEEVDRANRAMELLGGNYRDVFSYKLASGDVLRNLLVVDKEDSTPVKYPRRPGIPAKRPL